MLRKQNGLTLIALIITIIVMIILAGVSLSLTTGDDGVLNKAKLAREETRAGQVKEILDLWVEDTKIAREIGTNDEEPIEELINRLKEDKLLTEEEIIKINDSNNVNKEVKIGDQTISFKDESSNTDFDDGGLGYTQADIDNTLKYFTFDKSTGILTSKDDVIGTYKNRKNVSLKTAVFPKEIEGVVVKEIRSTLEYGWGVLANINDLEKVIILSEITEFGEAPFEGCKNLKSVELPNTLTKISNYAFSGCTNLTSIKIPSSVTRISSSVFSGCTNLTSVTIPSSVTSIDGSVFYGCANLTNIEVDEANAIYDSRENCNAIIKTSTNELIRGCKNTTIPSSVTSIGSSAFSGSTGLTSVTIPDVVISIGSTAFYGCTGLTSITIPNGVTSIGYNTFYGCTNLTSIVIPSSVKSIGNYTFYDCTSLKDVYYAGTEAEWNAMAKGSYNSALTNATITCNYGK